MDDSLSHPAWGYYSSGRVGFGESRLAADFTTFPISMRPFFGALLADRLHSLWLATAAKAGEGDASGGHETFVVVELGADASAGDMDGLTPVHHAAAGGHAATVRLLVSELGAEADAADVDGLTAVHCAALRAGLDEGLLSLTLPILFYMDNPYRCNECQ